MANPFADPDFGKATAPKVNPFADPNFNGQSVGPGPDRGQRALDYIEGLAGQAAQGATLGYIDEAASLFDSALPGGRTYDAALKRNRAIDESFSRNNPAASTAAQVGGAILAMPAMPFLGPVTGATMLGNAARGALVGAGYGGAAGFGHGEGGLENRLLSAGIGATGGAALGGLLPPLIAGGGAVARGVREGPIGRAYADAAAPAYDKAAGVVESLVRRKQPGSLSAAAPEGGQGLPVDSPMLSVAEALRRRAAANRDVSTRGAQERLAREFDRYGLDPQNIGRELERIPDAMLANAGPVGTLDRFARTMADMPGPSGSIIRTAVKEQREGAPDRMLRAVEGDTPPPTVYDATRYLAANKSQVGADVYDPLRAAKLNVSGDMQKLLEVPAIREAYDQMVAEAAKHGRTLTPFDLMHGVKRQLNRNADAAFASGRPVNKEMVGSVADEWERAIYAANKGIQQADEKYAAAAQLPDLLQQGRDFLRTGTSEAADAASPSALAAMLPQLDDAGRLVFSVGTTNTIRDKAFQGPAATRRLAGSIDESRALREKLVEIYGPERAEAIIANARNERRFLENAGTMVGGSGTAGNVAHLIDDGLSLPNITVPGNTPGVVMSLVNKGLDLARKQQAGNEPIRTEVARLLAERNPTANLQNLDVVEALMRQRLNAQLRNSRAGAGAASVGGGELGGVY